MRTYFNNEYKMIKLYHWLQNYLFNVLSNKILN